MMSRVKQICLAAAGTVAAVALIVLETAGRTWAELPQRTGGCSANLNQVDPARRKPLSKTRSGCFLDSDERGSHVRVHIGRCTAGSAPVGVGQLA